MLTNYGKRRILNLVPHETEPGVFVVGDVYRSPLVQAIAVLYNSSSPLDPNQTLLGTTGEVGRFNAYSSLGTDENWDRVIPSEPNGIGLRRYFPMISFVGSAVQTVELAPGTLLDSWPIAPIAHATDLAIIDNTIYRDYDPVNDGDLVSYLRGLVANEQVVARVKIGDVSISEGSSYYFTPFFDVKLFSDPIASPPLYLFKQDPTYPWLSYTATLSDQNSELPDVFSSYTGGGEFDPPLPVLDFSTYPARAFDPIISNQDQGLVSYTFPSPTTLSVRLSIAAGSVTPPPTNVVRFQLPVGYVVLDVEMHIDPLLLPPTGGPLDNWDGFTFEIEGML